MPSTEMNSVTIKPTPPSSFINRRKDESVTPAIGASARFGVILRLPMLNSPIITKQKSLAYGGNGRQRDTVGASLFSNLRHARMLHSQPENTRHENCFVAEIETEILRSADCLFTRIDSRFLLDDA